MREPGESERPVWLKRGVEVRGQGPKLIEVGEKCRSWGAQLAVEGPGVSF